MRIKLLKKMYRQTNEAIKRGDVFQQRPCPFYNEMDRIFSGNDDSNNPSGLSNSQSSLLNEDEDEDIEPEDENQIFTDETSNGDKFSQAIDRFIEYQKQNEVKNRSPLIEISSEISLNRIVGMPILTNKRI